MIKIPQKRDQKHHYSPLRYPGGKTFLFPLFDSMIKKKKLMNTTYIEPYAGGAGAALALLYLEKVERIVINDLDKAIYSFWKSAICESDRFIEKLRSAPVTVSEWRKQKAIYSNPRSRQFDLGFSAFFLNRTNISGILDGGPIGGIEQKGQWKINARFNKMRLSEQIRKLSQYRNRITICNKDGIEVIDEYINKQDAFIYLDPPYFEKGAALYLNHYQIQDHEILANLLNRHYNACWALTYDNHKEIKELYSKRRKFAFSLCYNAYEARRGKEILILSEGLA